MLSGTLAAAAAVAVAVRFGIYLFFICSKTRFFFLVLRRYYMFRVCEYVLHFNMHATFPAAGALPSVAAAAEESTLEKSVYFYGLLQAFLDS